MEPAECDIAIIGGGPAGAAAALALRRHAPGRSVALFEASHHEGRRIGETLHPAAQPLMVRLGVWERFLRDEHLEAAGTLSAWGQEALGGDDYVTSLWGRGFHLDRRRFDAMLVEEAAAGGATVQTGVQLTAAVRAPGGFRLTLRDEAGRTRELRASFVIDASGRRARFASLLGVRRILFDQQVGSAVFFEHDDALDTRLLVEAVELGWWYSARLPGGGSVAAFMTDGELAGRHRLGEPGPWQRALAASTHTRRRLEGARAQGEPTVFPAGSGRLERCCDDGWLAVGDAAASFDPLSGQGMVKALHNGLMAAYAASDHLDGREEALPRFRSLIESEFEVYLETRDDHYGREGRWPDSPYWRRRRPLVTLAPTQRLAADAAGPATIDRLTMHLSPQELYQLWSRCSAPTPAAEVVTGFRQAFPTVPARRVVLALQYLLEQRVLCAVAPGVA